METVKVDIQKLQLLNDRIAQTIDALNQVRLSVHGIQHSSSPMAYGQPYGQPGFGYGTPFAQPYNVGVPFAQAPFAQGPFVGSPFTPGLSHTTSPVGQMWGMPSTTGWGNTGVTQAWNTPFLGIGLGGGIGHTSYDPMWQVRAAQTFPFAQLPYPAPVYGSNTSIY